MNPTQIDTPLLRRLADIHTEKGVILSIYINLDRKSFAIPAERISQINSMCDRLGKALVEYDGKGYALKQAQEDVERLRSLVLAASENSGSAQALGAFYCSAIDLAEIIPLPTAIEGCYYFNNTPFIEPLAIEHAREEWCVLLVNRRSGRIFRGSHHQLTQVGVVNDEVPGQHDQGGWSQARYQRAVEKEKQDHLQHVADELFTHYQSAPFSCLLIGATHEMQHEIRDHLHPYLADRVAGCFEIDIEHAPVEEVYKRALPLMQETRTHDTNSLSKKLRAGLERGDHATGGIEDTLDALYQRKVATLLLAEGYHMDGYRCGECGWMGSYGKNCPIDDTPLIHHADLIEDAVEAAVTQSAEVVFVPQDQLGDAGPLAAITRY